MLKAIDTSAGTHTSFAVLGEGLHASHFIGEEGAHTWSLIAPALPLGIVLYVLKREHWSNPIVYIPYLLIVPTITFYGILFAVYGVDGACFSLSFPCVFSFSFSLARSRALLLPPSFSLYLSRR